jgi:hypothetical protein
MLRFGKMKEHNCLNETCHHGAGLEIFAALPQTSRTHHDEEEVGLVLCGPHISGDLGGGCLLEPEDLGL